MRMRTAVYPTCLNVLMCASFGQVYARPPQSVKLMKGPLGMEFVPLPKATFYMGWNGKNGSTKKTEIREDFEIAVYTVTQGQWEALTGDNPSFFSRDGKGKEKVKDISDEELKQFPVESVSWQDAQEFIKKLNEKEKGKGYFYRLPTEAEWEYACRGGATSLEECCFSFYLDRPTNELSWMQANVNGTVPNISVIRFSVNFDLDKRNNEQSRRQAEVDGAVRYFSVRSRGLNRPAKVGSYAPNKLGLYDMHGNVCQWCADVYDPNGSEWHRAYRGCAWNDLGASAAWREKADWFERYKDLGFRLVRVRTAR